MRCELCSSGKRFPRRKLCEASTEAIARLLAIASRGTGVIASSELRSDPWSAVMPVGNETAGATDSAMECIR